MNPKSPFKNAQGIPICPKCKIVLPEGPETCPQCGQPLWGAKLHRRTALGCLLGLIPVAAISGFNRYLKSRTPDLKEGTAAPMELTVAPETTHWEAIRCGIDGVLVVQVAAGPIAVSINASPLGSKGMTAELQDKAGENSVEVPAGKSGERTIPVQAGKTYAIFVINDTDKPAGVRLTTILRRK